MEDLEAMDPYLWRDAWADWAQEVPAPCCALARHRIASRGDGGCEALWAKGLSWGLSYWDEPGTLGTCKGS